MKRLTVLVLALAILTMAALPALGAIPNRFLGDRFQPIGVTVLATAGTIALPTGRQGVFLVLVNDGTNDAYISFNTPATTANSFVLHPNEEIQIPVAVTSLGHICAAGETTLLRGGIWYY